MPFLLITKQNGSQMARVDLRERRKLTIGRSPRCDLILTSPSISRRHALLFEHGGEWIVVDTASKCGLYCSRSGRVVRRVALRPGTWARIGPAYLQIEQDGGADRIVVPPAGFIERGLGIAPLGVKSPRLTVVAAGADAPLKYDLADREVVTIGRSDECDLTLEDERLAPLHSILYLEHRGWYIADAGSGLSTRVNGQPYRRCRMGEDRVVEIGESRLEVVGNRRYGLFHYDPSAPDEDPSDKSDSSLPMPGDDPVVSVPGGRLG